MMAKFSLSNMCWTLTLLIVSLLQVMPGKKAIPILRGAARPPARAAC